MGTVNRKYADALLYAIGKSGLSLTTLARMSGLHINTLYNWANARSIPNERNWNVVRHYTALPTWRALRAKDARTSVCKCPPETL